MSEQSLGTVLRLAREAQGLDRKQLAALLDVAASAITRWEQDQYLPSPRMLIELARHLEVRTAELFTRAKLPVPEELGNLPAMLRAEYGLPPEAIAEIQETIEQIAEKYRNTQ